MGIIAYHVKRSNSNYISMYYRNSDKEVHVDYLYDPHTEMVISNTPFNEIIRGLKLDESYDARMITKVSTIDKYMRDLILFERVS